MKIQNTEKLIDRLDRDLAWRKKELTLIVNSVKSAQKEEINTQLRIGIAMLYAHWEGFIKNSSIYYLNYLSQKKYTYEELGENYVALALKGQFAICMQTKKTSLHTKLVDMLINNLSDCATIPYENVIKTNSNLKWEVFKEILDTLGFDDSFYETKEKLIDQTLVDNRNYVAHGQITSIDKTEFLNLYNEIMSMINIFKEQIVNSAVNKTYKKVEIESD